MSGIETLKAFKKEILVDPSPIIVFLTCSDNPREIEECIKEGANDYLVKPDTIEGYEKIIKSIA
jgi:CheY-like chemotaxis protein